MTSFTRRYFLSSAASLGALAALSPVLVRRADATPGAGELQMVAVTPNPA